MAGRNWRVQRLDSAYEKKELHEPNFVTKKEKPETQYYWASGFLALVLSLRIEGAKSESGILQD